MNFLSDLKKMGKILSSKERRKLYLAACLQAISGLFDAALGKIFDQALPKWEDRGWGVPVENVLGENFTNSRFADDVLLVAFSLRQLKAMVADLIQASQVAGLCAHSNRTNISSNHNQYGRH